MDLPIDTNSGNPIPLNFKQIFFFKNHWPKYHDPVYRKKIQNLNPDDPKMRKKQKEIWMKAIKTLFKCEFNGSVTQFDTLLSFFAFDGLPVPALPEIIFDLIKLKILALIDNHHEDAFFLQIFNKKTQEKLLPTCYFPRKLEQYPTLTLCKFSLIVDIEEFRLIACASINILSSIKSVPIVCASEIYKPFLQIFPCLNLFENKVIYSIWENVINVRDNSLLNAEFAGFYLNLLCDHIQLSDVQNLIKKKLDFIREKIVKIKVAKNAFAAQISINKNLEKPSVTIDMSKFDVAINQQQCFIHWLERDYRELDRSIKVLSLNSELTKRSIFKLSAINGAIKEATGEYPNNEFCAEFTKNFANKCLDSINAEPVEDSIIENKKNISGNLSSLENSDKLKKIDGLEMEKLNKFLSKFNFS